MNRGRAGTEQERRGEERVGKQLRSQETKTSHESAARVTAGERETVGVQVSD